MKKPRILLFASVCIIAISGLTSCFSPSSVTTTTTTAAATTTAAGNATTASAAESTAASTQLPSDTTLVVWDGQTDGDAYALYQGFADGFAQEMGITVERVAMKTEDLRNTIKPAINSGEGPDVFSYDPGAGYLGVLAKSGLALDLTDYVKTAGWDSRFMKWTLDQCTFGDRLYGIGNQVEALGVYYNKAIFTQYGTLVLWR